MTEIEKLKKQNAELADGIRAVRRMMDTSKGVERMKVTNSEYGIISTFFRDVAWNRVEESKATQQDDQSEEERFLRAILEPFYAAEHTAEWETK